MKICSKCNIEKPLSDFGKHKKGKNGKNARCLECGRAASKKWSSENKDKVSAYRKSYAAEFPEKVKLATERWAAANKSARAEYARKRRSNDPERHATLAREWALANKEWVSERRKIWVAANPEKILARDQNRRARKLSAKGKHSGEEIKFIFESQRGLCATCEIKLIQSGKNKFHVDHIVPLARGGSNDKYNLQCLCPSCNLRKKAKDPLDWANQNGKLL